MYKISKKLIILSCGGTISMTRNQEGSVGFSQPDQASNLLKSRSNGSRISDLFEIEHHSFSSLPSSEMSFELVLKLSEKLIELSKKNPAGIIVTHGTDALEDTAFVLGLTLPRKLGCFVVLTAAMLPASDTNYDGAPNVEQAVLWINQAKSTTSFELIGPVVIMNQQAHPSSNTFKQHTRNISAFNNKNTCIAEFDSTKQVWNQTKKLSEVPPIFNNVLVQKESPPRVEIVYFYAGDDGASLNVIVEKTKPKAIVINALGCGNVNDATSKGIKKAIESGLIVVIATRVPYGSTFAEYDYAGGGANLEKLGVIFSGRLRATQARLLLQLCFLEGLSDRSEISKQFASFNTLQHTT